jgi:hypothetical protein
MSSKPSNASDLANATSQTPLLPDKVEESIFNGFQITQAIYVTAQLGLADHLNNNAKSCEELAVDMGVNAKVLQHLMQLLLTLGIVAKAANDKYQLTQFGCYLRSDTPDSALGTVLSLAEIYQAWGDLLHSVKTGKAAFDHSFHKSLYDYLAENAEANANFNRWMEETTRDWLLPALDSYDFSKFTQFVDVGGSTGVLTAEILSQYPNLQAIIFDQAHVVNDAGKILESVRDRCQIIGGDFFESILAKGDLYIISRVLLNWDDEHALKILKNCRAAMDNSAKLLIMDFVLPNENTTASDLLSSLHSLVLCGRLLRTEEEYYALLGKAGFQSPKLIQTGGAISFIEALPK